MCEEAIAARYGVVERGDGPVGGAGGLESDRPCHGTDSPGAGRRVIVLSFGREREDEEEQGRPKKTRAHHKHLPHEIIVHPCLDAIETVLFSLVNGLWR